MADPWAVPAAAAYGFMYAWTFGWRAAYLPHRDWPPREDEMPVPVAAAD